MGVKIGRKEGRRNIQALLTPVKGLRTPWNVGCFSTSLCCLRACFEKALLLLQATPFPRCKLVDPWQTKPRPIRLRAVQACLSHMYLFAWLVQLKHLLKKVPQLTLVQGSCLLPISVQSTVSGTHPASPGGSNSMSTTYIVWLLSELLNSWPQFAQP